MFFFCKNMGFLGQSSRFEVTVLIKLVTLFCSDASRKLEGSASINSLIIDL
jgi:hypothetical protein